MKKLERDYRVEHLIACVSQAASYGTYAVRAIHDVKYDRYDCTETIVMYARMAAGWAIMALDSLDE